MGQEHLWIPARLLDRKVPWSQPLPWLLVARSILQILWILVIRVFLFLLGLRQVLLLLYRLAPLFPLQGQRHLFVLCRLLDQKLLWGPAALSHLPIQSLLGTRWGLSRLVLLWGLEVLSRQRHLCLPAPLSHPASLSALGVRCIRASQGLSLLERQSLLENLWIREDR